MKEKINYFVQQVLDNMVVDEKMKERIKNDLYQHINEASLEKDIESVLKSMGDPQEVAKEFMDTIYQDKEDVIEKLIQERIRTRELKKNYYEYKSKKLLFGIPLIHIKYSNSRRFKKPCVAKGIIAIGDVALGIIAIGVLPVGILSIGAAAGGILALGGMAIGGIAIGGIALGLMAIGGLAVGLGAMGGCAIGNIAVGGYAKGTVAIGGKAVGEYVISGGVEGGTYNLSQVTATREEVYSLIKTAYPRLSDWIVNIFTIFF